MSVLAPSVLAPSSGTQRPVTISPAGVKWLVRLLVLVAMIAIHSTEMSYAQVWPPQPSGNGNPNVGWVKIQKHTEMQIVDKGAGSVAPAYDITKPRAFTNHLNQNGYSHVNALVIFHQNSAILGFRDDDVEFNYYIPAQIDPNELTLECWDIGGMLNNSELKTYAMATKDGWYGPKKSSVQFFYRYVNFWNGTSCVQHTEIKALAGWTSRHYFALTNNTAGQGLGESDIATAPSAQQATVRNNWNKAYTIKYNSRFVDSGWVVASASIHRSGAEPTGTLLTSTSSYRANTNNTKIDQIFRLKGNHRSVVPTFVFRGAINFINVRMRTVMDKVMTAGRFKVRRLRYQSGWVETQWRVVHTLADWESAEYGAGFAPLYPNSWIKLIVPVTPSSPGSPLFGDDDDDGVRGVPDGID